MCVDVEWNMNGEPEWKDELPKDESVVTKENLTGFGKDLLAASNSGEFWIIRKTLDGWRLVSEKPLHDKVKAAGAIRIMSPGIYKILETTASYQTQVALMPLEE